jgi:predicted carbohydrate-binding protein with CBM5 and CBM33 domain
MKYFIATNHLLSVKKFALLLTFVSVISAHGWVKSPKSKNEMSYHHWVNGMCDSLRYEP